MHTPSIELLVALGLTVLMFCLPWKVGFIGYLAVFVLASVAMHQQQHRHTTCDNNCRRLGLPLRAYSVDSTDMLVVVDVAAPDAAAARLPGQDLFAGGADGQPAARLGVVDKAQPYKDTVVVALREPLPRTLHPSTPLYAGAPPAPSAAALTPALATAFDTLINVAQYIALIGTVAMLVPGIRTAFRFLLTGVLAAALLGAVLILLLNEKIEHVKNRVETARPGRAVRGWWGRLF